MKAQRLIVAAALAFVLIGSAPVARADGMTEPNGTPNGFAVSFGECLSQAVLMGLDIVSSAL
ncbi:MAG: hypothetical protein ABI689_17930 [Thermoanaerobaculia bacterium]